jgi:LysR family carnitine catabolism transcriptional activator
VSIDIGLRHLRVAVAVADAGGYTSAARDLHLAQSSLSRTILELEGRLGVQLFERTTRHVSPTRDGEEFLAIARRLLNDFDAELRHFQGYLSGARGSVSIAALPSLAATLLPPVLAAFRAERPQVTVSVRDGLSAEVLELVLGGSVDMAVTVATTVPRALRSILIAVDEFSCVFQPGHRLGQQSKVRWTDLEGEAFVAFDPGSSIRSITDATLAAHHITLGAVTEARNIGAVAGLTGAGLGLTAVPGLVLPMMNFAGLLARPLVAPTVERHICLIHHPDRPQSRTAAALFQLLADADRQSMKLPAGVRWTTPEKTPTNGLTATPRASY